MVLDDKGWAGMLLSIFQQGIEYSGIMGSGLSVGVVGETTQCQKGRTKFTIVSTILEL
jgi:hypothetical protein